MIPTHSFLNITFKDISDSNTQYDSLTHGSNFRYNLLSISYRLKTRYKGFYNENSIHRSSKTTSKKEWLEYMNSKLLFT